VSATLLVSSRLTPGAVQIDRRDTAAEACAAARAEHARTGAAVRVVADGAELLAIPESADEDDALENLAEVLLDQLALRLADDGAAS